MLPRRPRDMKNNVELHKHHMTPKLKLHAFEWDKTIAGGVVVQHIEATELRNSRLNPRSSRLWVTEVNRMSGHIEPLIAQLRRRRVGGSILNVTANNTCT